MGLLWKSLRALAGVGGFALVAFATLLRETFFELITSPIADSITSAQATLGGEYIFRTAIAFVGVLLLLVAIGPDRIQASIRWLSEWRSGRPVARPAVESEPRDRAPVEAMPTTPQPPQTTTSQPNDEGLEQSSHRLADDLFQFLAERKPNDPEITSWPGVGSSDTDPESQRHLNEYVRVKQRYDGETMDLYRQRFGGRATRLLRALRQRGWWPPEDLDPEELRRIEDPLVPLYIQRLAQQLSAVGR